MLWLCGYATRMVKGMTVPTIGGNESNPLNGTGLGSGVDSANSMAGSAGGLDISIKFSASQSQSSQVVVGMGQTGSNVLANTIVLNIGDPDNPHA